MGGLWQQGHWPLPLAWHWARHGVMPGVDATGAAVMSTSITTAIPISIRTLTARITKRGLKRAGKLGAAARGNMTPVIGGEAPHDDKGRPRASTEGGSQHAQPARASP